MAGDMQTLSVCLRPRGAGYAACTSALLLFEIYFVATRMHPCPPFPSLSLPLLSASRCFSSRPHARSPKLVSGRMVHGLLNSCSQEAASLCRLCMVHPHWQPPAYISVSRAGGLPVSTGSCSTGAHISLRRGPPASAHSDAQSYTIQTDIPEMDPANALAQHRPRQG